MVSRRNPSTLSQLLEFTSEDVVHSKLSANFFCDIQPSSPPGVQIDFLEDQNVGMFASEKTDYFVQTHPTLDIPVDDAKCGTLLRFPSRGRETANPNIVHASPCLWSLDPALGPSLPL
jgi:hypothetical protein